MKQASLLFVKRSTATEKQQSVADVAMRRHALASPGTMFVSGLEDVKREYVEKIWLNAQDGKEIVEEE